MSEKKKKEIVSVKMPYTSLQLYLNSVLFCFHTLSQSVPVAESVFFILEQVSLLIGKLF